MNSIKERLNILQNNIKNAAARAGRKSGEIQLVLVTKYAAIDKVAEAVKCGCCEIGENRQQELQKKYNALKEILSENEFQKIKWHFIGHLQTNKIKNIINYISMIQSVDSLHLAEAINKCAGKSGRKIDILIQINISGEETKFGIDAGALENFLKAVVNFPHLVLKGLMGIGPLSDEPEASRSGFRMLKQSYTRGNELLTAWGCPNMSILSMGMTNDYQVAIEEGATMLRVGSAIFGG